MIFPGASFPKLKSLSQKMTLFYGGLFTLGMALVLAGSRIAIEHYAEHIIDRELTSSSRVFQRFAAMRYDQMQQAAQVLAADFGFRAAVATHDEPTIASALASLKARLGISHAFLVDLDGKIFGLDEQIGKRDAQTLWRAVDNGATHGVLQLGKYDYRAGAAPVKIPDLAGWVVFANRLDAKEMSTLTDLSAVPLKAHIVPIADVGKDIAVALPGSTPAVERDVNGERILIQASPIDDFSQASRQALVLEYSLTAALGEYSTMFWMLFACALGGVSVTICGSWYLSRKLARPIEALDLAARRVSAGEPAQVEVWTNDEIGRLAESFNAMVNDINDRERQIVLTQAQAQARLERTISEVQAENDRLNSTARIQRSTALQEAGRTLEAELAPLLVVFDDEARRLMDAAKIMQTNLDLAEARASEAARSAENTRNLTLDITHSAEHLALSGKQISSEASATSAVVDHAAEGNAAATTSFSVLRAAIDDIGTVTNEIRAISNKTNMLALNASIEAARAGEMGLSFSAVATEVKELARTTASLTAAIGERLAQVALAMSDADMAILKVNDALVTAGEAASTIANGAVQQSTATSAISGGIANIARDSQSVVGVIVQVDAAAAESKKIAEQIRESANAVSARAVRLRKTLDIYLEGLRHSA